MEQNTLEITEQFEVFEFTTFQDVVNQTLKESKIQNPPSINLQGIPTGFKNIDTITSGLKNGELIFISTRPGMGKTAFLLSLSTNIAIKNNHSVAIFSSERSSKKIVHRLIETETGYSIEKICNGKLKESERDHAFSIINNISKAKIFIDDTPSLSVDELTARAKQLKINNNVNLIIVDYFELLTTSILDKDEREIQLKNIVAAVKKLAKEIDVPIVLFSQLHKENIITDTDKRPTITELPDYIKNTADQILFVHRPLVNHLSNTGCAEIIIAKNDKSVEQIIVNLKFIDSISKFVDYN